MRRFLLALLISCWSTAALADINTRVATAPGVLASHAYTLGPNGRVNAGPGWNGTTWTSGSAVCLFALTAAGTTGSGAITDFNTACASGTEANVGGGLDGSIPSAWASATHVTSGTATFVLIWKNVDYATHTGMSCDDAAWLPNTTYPPRAFVVNGGNCYQQGNIYGIASCVSGNSGGPTGTSPGADGTCTGAAVWTYMGALTYSSNANKWPHAVLVDQGGGNFAAETQYAGHVTVTYAWGGREIVESINGESSPMRLWSHQQFEPGDQPSWCLGQIGVAAVPNCSPVTYYTLTVLSGDSFVDNVTPGTGPLAYDGTKGVTFHGTSNANPPGYDFWGQALDLEEGYGFVTRLQFKSDHSSCLPTTTAGPFLQGDGHTNGGVLSYSLLDCAGGAYALSLDAGWIVQNVAIIQRNTANGVLGIWVKYDTQFANVTIYGPGIGITNSTCIVVASQLAPSDPITPWHGIACFGFAHGFAYQVTNPPWTGSGNTTDGPSSDSGTFTGATGTVYTIGVLPGVGNTCGAGNTGTCYGLSATNQFVNGASDLRLKSGADILGASVTYNITSPPAWAGYWQNVDLGPTVVSPDIFGTARPQAGRYDAGAFEFTSGAPPPPVKGAPRGGLWH